MLITILIVTTGSLLSSAACVGSFILSKKPCELPATHRFGSRKRSCPPVFSSRRNEHGAIYADNDGSFITLATRKDRDNKNSSVTV